MGSIKIEYELELNRKWIYNDDGETIGEENFTIKQEYFIKIFKELFPGQNMDDFLEVYIPEEDGEKIYQRAKQDCCLIEDEATKIT